MITTDLIIENLPATSKKQAFHLIAEKTAALYFGDTEVLFNALIERERIGSTGIGCGVAIPHIKLEGITKMYGVLTRLEKPVDYDALDDQPVDIIYMLLAPSDSKTTEHLKALAQISRFLKEDSTCQQIRGCCEREKIVSLLQEWAKSQAA